MKHDWKVRFGVALGVVWSYIGVATSSPALAQEFPERPVRLVIPFAPGGNTDIVGRRLGARIAGPLGQQLIVDNRSGAGGTIGSAEVARAKPDGYTLLLATSSSHAINPTAMPKIPYDAVKDFAGITAIGTVSQSLVIHPSIPAKNVREFVALAKARPGQFAYGSTGIGGINHLGGELFKQKAGGLNIVHVPYKSSGLSLQDVIGGHLPVVIATVSAALPHHRNNRVRILAIFNDERTPAAPDIPTSAEAGVPGVAVYTFNIVLAPAGTPAPVVDRLHKAFATVMADDSFAKELVELGVEPIRRSSPKHASDFVRTEIARWAPLVRASLQEQ